jgi:hypothetical protein
LLRKANGTFSAGPLQTSKENLFMAAVSDLPDVPGNVVPARPGQVITPCLKAQFQGQKHRSKPKIRTVFYSFLIKINHVSAVRPEAHPKREAT